MYLIQKIVLEQELIKNMQALIWNKNFQNQIQRIDKFMMVLASCNKDKNDNILGKKSEDMPMKGPSSLQKQWVFHYTSKVVVENVINPFHHKHKASGNYHGMTSFRTE